MPNAEPCEKFRVASGLVRRASQLMDVPVYRRELEDMQRRLEAAANQVHQLVCLPWKRMVEREREKE